MICFQLLLDNYDDLRDAEVVLEAVFENLKQKEALSLSRVAGKDTLIGSNTVTEYHRNVQVS